MLWGFIRAYAPDAGPEANPGLDRLVGHALKYYEDFVKPHKSYRSPTEKERAALYAFDEEALRPYFPLAKVTADPDPGIGRFVCPLTSRVSTEAIVVATQLPTVLGNSPAAQPVAPVQRRAGTPNTKTPNQFIERRIPGPC